MPLVNTKSLGIERFGFDSPYVPPKYWVGGWSNSGYGAAVEGVDGATYYAGYNTITKVDKNGRLVWAKTDGTSSIPNIYVAKISGSFLFVAGSDASNGYIAKLSIADGSVSFARTLANFSYITDLDFDASGNIYLCGEEKVATGDFRPAAIKLTSTGTLSTARRYVKATSTTIQGVITNIKYVSNFNTQGEKIIMSGIDTTNNNSFIMIANTSLQDDLLEMHIQGTNYAVETGFLLDSSQNIYLYSHDGGVSNYTLLLKVNASGTFQWARRYTGFINNYLSGIVDLDQNIQLFVNDIGFLKINSSGTTVSSYGVDLSGGQFRIYMSDDGTIVGNGNSIFKLPYTHDVTVKNFGTTVYPTTFSTTSTSVTSTSLSYATGTSLYSDAAGSITSASNTVAWSDTVPTFTLYYAS